MSKFFLYFCIAQLLLVLLSEAVRVLLDKRRNGNVGCKLDGKALPEAGRNSGFNKKRVSQTKCCFANLLALELGIQSLGRAYTSTLRLIEKLKEYNWVILKK